MAVPITQQMAVRTHSEISAIMTQRGYPMSRTRVHQIEKKALLKLRSDPILRRVFEGADEGVGRAARRAFDQFVSEIDE